jgi:glutamate-1-semialdehyde 2,1-aminomutase
MGAMHEFLHRIGSAQVLELYRDLDTLWNGRVQRLNERLHAEDLNVRIANLSSIWTVTYPQPSRYNWMLQYYLRAHGLALSWVGTGRLIFSLDYTDAEFAEVAERFVSAARQMRADGWWWRTPALTNESIRRRVLKELIRAAVRRGRGSSDRSLRPAAGKAAPGSTA